MKRVWWVSTLLWGALAIGLSIGFAQQLFEGELEVVHYRAPELPSPASMGSPVPATPAPQLPAPSQPMGRPDFPAQAPNPSSQSTPSFTSNGITWVNSSPLTMRKLRGQVVLIDFWEYTCINCIRALDTNKEWYSRYHRYGFQIIGVHDPEFGIASSLKNARDAIKRFELSYPIAIDNDRIIWNEYHSDSWPNRFLIDANGYVRYHRAGEGGDSAFEAAIQQLLREAHPDLTFPARDVIPPAEDAFSPACGVTTPEMYVGDWYGRGTLANPEGYRLGRTLDYQVPDAVNDGRVVLDGKWQTYRDGMTYRGKKTKSGSPAGELQVRYHARELYSVINVSRGHPERLYITQDGQNLTKENKGVDVEFDAQGRSYVEVREPRMYYLVSNPVLGSHTVVLSPTAPGITVNSFTFGNNCQTRFAHL
jgi:Thioredoxin like C-terminal domain/AhpC/TSA family